MPRTESALLQAWLLLSQTHGLLAKRLNRRMRTVGLSCTLALPLLALRDAGQPLQLSHIARLLAQEPQNMTNLVDRLEGLGLVRREAATQDRRVIHLVLTPAGEAAIDGVAATLADALQEVFAALSSRELRAFTKRLGAVQGRGTNNPGRSRGRVEERASE